MNWSIWFYWFPLVLIVGLTAAWLGRQRAAVISVLAAGYWIALSMLADGGCDDPVQWLMVLLGAGVLAGVGLWMSNPKTTWRKRIQAPSTHAVSLNQAEQAWTVLGNAITRFEDWLTINRHLPDPWPDFGEFVRSSLLQMCNAKHIHAYRLLTYDDSQLYPLRRVEPEELDFPSARAGIIGHVVTSGKGYYADDPAQGELVKQLAANDPSRSGECAWCFAIRQDHHTIGVVQVNEMTLVPQTDRARLRTIEGFISLCWAALTETCRGRLASSIDSVSGVLTQDAFIEAGKRSLQISYERGEPVAMANIGIEGLRTLTDNGQWDLANQILYEVSSLIKERLRQGDEIGVFDGSRFLLLLRGVDSELAMLIAGQLMDRLSTVCEDRRCKDSSQVKLSVRCGVAGSGIVNSSSPNLRTLITRATANCQEARKQGVPIVSDLAVAEKVCQE